MAAASEPTLDLAAIDRAVDDTVQRYHLPGIAVGVIEDGKVVYRGTRGELATGSGEAIDGDSLFKIASLTKAMTTAVLARLVDRGQLAWNDPVVKHLPQFRMSDPWVTQNMQVRDLLIHNSGLGLGAGDLMLWPEPNDFDRADIIAGLAHLKPTHSFRSDYAYDNLLYVVAGEVAAAAGGKPYSQLLREEIFQPLGMRRCQSGDWNPAQVGNVAQPHMRQGQGNVVVREDGGQVADFPSMAAGGVRCSLDDMLVWMLAWLQPDDAWLSTARRRELWTLHTPMPINQRMRDWDNTHLHGYGYAWRLSDADGQWRVAHTGTLMGMYASLVLFPDRNGGFVFLINGAGGEARTVLTSVLEKHFTRPQSPGLDVAHFAGLLRQENSQPASAASAAVPDAASRRAAPAAALPGWQGVWRDAWFGEVALCPSAGGLYWTSRKSPLMAGQVMQVGERLLIDWHEDSVDAEAWLHFDEGRMTLSHVDPEADFSYDYPDLDFVRVGGCPR